MAKRFIVGVLLSLLGGVAAAQAAPLNLTVPHDPLISADGFYVQFTVTNATMGHLSATGFPSSFNYGPGVNDTMPLDTGNSWFDLEADLYKTGVPISGTLAVYGAPLAPENPDPPLLFNSWTITAVGYSSGGHEAVLEFTFTEDTLTSVVNPGAHLGVILPTTSIDGSPTLFANAFSNNALGQANFFFMPEPGTIGLLIFGVCGLALRRRGK